MSKLRRAELEKRGAKKVNQRVKFKDEDPHKSRFARAFREMIYGKEKRS